VIPIVQLESGDLWEDGQCLVQLLGFYALSVRSLLNDSGKCDGDKDQLVDSSHGDLLPARGLHVAAQSMGSALSNQVRIERLTRVK